LKAALAWVAVVAVLIVPAGCGQGEGPGHRSQALALTAEQELALGEKAYREVLSKAQVISSGRDADRVRHIGESIARASEIKPLQREINLHIQPEYLQWEFKLLRDDHVNAFCLPGGKVAVFSGLLPVTQNDDQLATVMSHEIAHALAHHANERIARQQMYERAVRVAGGGENADPSLIGVLAAGAAKVNSLAYDRKQESEADHIGIFLMTFAGYDPRQAVVFWQRMEDLSNRRGHPPAILSDHPSDAQRIHDIQQWVPQAEAAKKAFDEGRIAPDRGG
jgi:predicted Zn-dependent protease